MNQTTLWGIIGILVAVVIFLLQRKRHYAGQLRFSLLEANKVMRAQKKNFQDLSLRYHEFEIEEDLTYVKFVLYNDKSFDYSNEDKSDPVQIILPENHKWIDAKIVDCSKNTNPEVLLNNNHNQELDLVFKLLKNNEYIEIDGLIESKEGENARIIQDDIEIKHRISNVAPSKTSSFLNEKSYKHSFVELVFTGSFFALLLFMILFFVFGHPTAQLQFEDVRTGDLKVLYVNNEGNIVYHKGPFIWSGYSVPVNPDAFSDTFKPSYTQYKRPFSDYFYYAFFGSILLAIGYLIHIDVVPIFETRKLRKILKQQSKERID